MIIGVPVNKVEMAKNIFMKFFTNATDSAFHIRSFLLLAATVSCVVGCASPYSTAKAKDSESEAIAEFSKAIHKQENKRKPTEQGDSFPKRLKNAIKPNIIFDNTSDDNNATELLVSIDRNSKVISVRLELSSGNKDWDNAVIAAVWKTGYFPRDVDGSIHPRLLLVFRPND